VLAAARPLVDQRSARRCRGVEYIGTMARDPSRFPRSQLASRNVGTGWWQSRRRWRWGDGGSGATVPGLHGAPDRQRTGIHADVWFEKRSTNGRPLVKSKVEVKVNAGASVSAIWPDALASDLPGFDSRRVCRLAAFGMPPLTP
jgi:hypothetical protein